MRRRGLAEGGATGDAGGLRLVVDHAVGGVRRDHVVTMATQIPGSREQGGGRQRECVDDGERRTGPAQHWLRRLAEPWPSLASSQHDLMGSSPFLAFAGRGADREVAGRDRDLFKRRGLLVRGQVLAQFLVADVEEHRTAGTRDQPHLDVERRVLPGAQQPAAP